MKKGAKGVGLAIIGAGRVGLFRGEVAARHPAVEWIGIAELNHNRGGDVGARIGADFITTSHRELLARPEVTCAIIATDEHLHVEPVLAAVERGVPMLIEKPLATDLAQSARVLKAITDAKLDAVVGYTQRFRRKWLGAKEKVRNGALGDVTMVTSRAFMNRLVAIDNYKRTNDPATISPMVISGTHALDIVMWYLEKKTPVECYARSVDKVLGPLYQGIDATAGMIMFSDGTVHNLSISWALPVTWPGAVYSLEVGINGTHGVLTIDDTHRDMVLAVSAPQSEGYAPDESRLVDFMGSYPPGDMVLGELRGPMADETVSWLNRISLGLPTQAATAAEAHNRLMLTKALDLSAKLKQPVKLPLVRNRAARPRSQPNATSSTAISLDLLERAHHVAGLASDLAPARAMPSARRSRRAGAAPMKPWPRCRQIARTRKPITAAAATASPGGRPASNDKPSLRAGGSNSIKAGIVARAAACEAISAHTTACAPGRLASAPTRKSKRHRQGADAVGADVAIAHDGEFLLARIAAAETVGGIGEAVFVQAAGRKHRGGNAERRRRPWRQPKSMGNAIDDRANEADDDARDWKRPGRAG